jgi:polar amino acid transport system permease protein
MRDVGRYVTDGYLLQGALIAIEIAAISMAVALVLGLALALLRLSRLRLARVLAGAYVWFVRGTPVLLQLVVLYDVLPTIGITLSPFQTAVVGFSLNQAAFNAEIIRGGIASVDRQQTLAAKSIGMGSTQAMRHVVLPQAMPAIIPALGNESISLLKATSLASVIAVNELTLRSQQVIAENFEFFTVFSAAALLYLAVTSVLGLLQRVLERRFDPQLRYAGAERATLQRLLTFDLGRRTRRSPEPAAAPPAAVPVRAAGYRSGEIKRAVQRSVAGDGERDGTPFVTVRGVRKAYAAREVLCGVDLDVQPHEVLAIIGPSGSGKSTLLRLVNHLEAVSDGTIRVDGAPVGYDASGAELRSTRALARARADARIGMVFQQFNLFAHLSAIDNVTLGPVRVYDEPRDAARARARVLLDAIGLAEHHDHLPGQLSGGQQQRVAIARALAIRPRLMLFDEPTSALDPELVAGILAVMRDLAEVGMTMIVVTHELQFAREVADHVVFIDEGRIVERGSAAEVLDHPAHARTRSFVQLVQLPPGPS